MIGFLIFLLIIFTFIFGMVYILEYRSYVRETVLQHFVKMSYKDFINSYEQTLCNFSRSSYSGNISDIKLGDLLILFSYVDWLRVGLWKMKNTRQFIKDKKRINLKEI